LDDNRDHGRFREDDARQVADAIAWQAQHFPQVAMSQGLPGGDFVSVDQAWRRDGEMIERLLAYQNRFASGMDDRVRGAHLVSLYSHHLSVAVAAVYLRTGLVPGQGGLAFRFEPAVPNDCGSVNAPQPSDACRFHFRVENFARGHDWAALLHDGFVENFTPMIDALQARTGLSPVAQWRLVADGIAGAFLEAGLALGEQERAMAAALAVINGAGSPLSFDAMHYQRISAICNGVAVERVFRLRSGCCLYYRTQGGDFCDVCVLLDDETKKSRLRAHVERTGGL
jgi:hypothetical protein